jgi:hypothetical protein
MLGSVIGYVIGVRGGRPLLDHPGRLENSRRGARPQGRLGPLAGHPAEDGIGLAGRGDPMYPPRSSAAGSAAVNPPPGRGLGHMRTLTGELDQAALR